MAVCGSWGAYPLAGTVERVFGDLAGVAFEDTGIEREDYLDLAERLARPALAWQQEDGGVVSPLVGEETGTINARFVGAFAGLIAGGRCLDAVEACARAMDLCCDEMETGERRPGEATVGPEFYTKELMFGYEALAGKVAEGRRGRWAEQLAGFDPWERYPSCRDEWDHNYPIYAVCGEQLKKRAGLADNSAFIEAVLDNQVKAFNAWGMYRDPGDPMTYDLTCRQQIGLMLWAGYDGRHRAFFDEMVRRGGLTQLLYSSVTGQMPYGGRSNQYHIMEAMAAVIGEMEARRYGSKQSVYAGAFKRGAHLAVRSIEPWIGEDAVYALKNRFLPEQRHGDENYNKSAYACYCLLTASLLGTAYAMADERLAEGAGVTDRGGYAVTIWPSFHRSFASCGGYHIEIDHKGEARRDATGLGRIHRRGIRPETGCSMSIPFEPHVHTSIAGAKEYAAVGPMIRWGVKGTPFARWAERVLGVAVSVNDESREAVRFSVDYTGDLPGVERLRMYYELSEDGVGVQCAAEGGELCGFTVPLLVTDGEGESEIAVLEDGFRVRYEGAVYEVRAEGKGAEELELVVGDEEMPNSVGIYRLGRFTGAIEGVVFRFRLEREGME